MTQERRAHALRALPRTLEFRKGCLDWSRPYVMGVLNLTPDSFSDGGRFADLESALEEARRMVGAGADILDIGGESTRPGAAAISADEECERVVPLIERLRADGDVLLSIDTSKAVVARNAVVSGAEIVNDISGGVFDSAMIGTLMELGCTFVCGHVPAGSLAEVHATSESSALSVRSELSARIAALPIALQARTIADPCLGFGKDLGANLELLMAGAELERLTSCPVLIGASRKRFLGEVSGRPVEDRDAASVGASLAAVGAGASIVRVHNVAMTVAALRVYSAARQAA